MQEIEEKQDITNKLNLLMMLLLTISIIVISSFILFFIGVTKVDALTWIQDIPKDGQPYLLGTRSNSVVTNKTYTTVTINDTVPPQSWYELRNINTKYISLGGRNNFIQDRIYKITIWYGGNIFTEHSGVCIGYHSLCNEGNQTPNSTIYNYSFPTSKEYISYNRIAYDDNTGTNYVASGQMEGYIGSIIFKANRDGTNYAMYFNTSTNDTKFTLYGLKIEDLGTSSDVITNALQTKTQQIIDWTTAKTNEIKLNDNNNTQSILNAISGQTTTINSSINNQTSTINNSLNNQTTSINNNTNTQINNSTNTITSNANTNSQNEINNENANTWECYNSQVYINDYPVAKSKVYLNMNGEYVSDEDWDVTKYIKIQPNSTYVFHTNQGNPNNQIAFCTYDSDYNKVACYRYSQQNITFISDPNAQYIKFSFDRNYDFEWIQGRTCVIRSEDGTQQIINQDDWIQQPPNEVPFEQLEGQEELVNDYLIDDSDISSLNFKIDTNSSQTIWQIFNNIVTGNTAVYNSFITILFLGIIKLLLAR